MNPYRYVASVMLLVTILLAGTLRAEAATFKVDRTSDDAAATACDDATPNDCSLRGAILAANALSEASIINVPAGTFVLSQSSTCTFRIRTSTPGIFTSSQIPLCLSKNITIQGAGADATIIDGDRRGRVLFVSADAVAEVRGVTLKNGTGGPAFFSFGGGGGGILNHGTLTLIEAVVSGNTLAASSRGAGIENFGSLSLRRSAVMNNVPLLGSEGGGGIHNEGFYSASVLIVSESTISNNVVGSFGGGISNGATATIINSTISGNTAKGFGGGIANLHAGGNFVARLTVINSTVSGNTSGTQGGGISAFNLTTVHLNNVTISNNTAGTSGAGTYSGGGTNYSGAPGGFTLQNTIIAGNRDLGRAPAPDCLAEAGNGTPVTSSGYNLIQDTTRCTILGDTTGNITGVDPQLGPLLDNGGLTQTHALSADSAALDGGNPGAPGSGGTACTATDERGFSRLQDGDGNSIGRCDIGAFELAESAIGFSFSGLRPNAAGNSESAYALIYGSGFVNGMTMRLTRAGEPDIVGSPTTVDAGGAVAATSFALTGRSPGVWDVVIANPDGESRILTDGFTIELGGAPQVWSEVVGPNAIRIGRPWRFALFVGNRGNVDARAVPVRIAIRSGVDVGLSFPITAPPFQTGQVRTDWSQTPLGVPTEDNTTNILLLLPLLPAGFTATLDVTLTAAESAVGQQYVLRGPADPPLFASDLDPQLVADQVAGARAYAEDAIGITIPPELAPDLELYLRTQLANLVENGRNALVASVGAQSQVYSRAQLVVDLARFGAVLAGAQPPPPLALSPRQGRGANEPIRVVANVEQGVVDRICTGVVSLVIPAAAHGQGGAVLGEGQSQKVGCGDNGGAVQGCIKSNNVVLGLTCCPKGMDNARCCGGGGGPFFGVRGKDPNDKAGPHGAGTARFIAGGDALRYAISFENLETENAAAQEVIITDQLDGTKVDFDTFSLGSISFGDRRVTPPPGLSQYSTSVDLRPAVDLLVAIDARLNKSTGLITWHFLSIDPLTGQFTEDPIAGFLPPNVNPPEGDGSVAFTIQPKVTDIPICNEASIIFDVNEAILTPEWCNTVDDMVPSSQVSALAPTKPSPSFIVEWSGTDTGSGIADYTVFVSENGGPFTPFVSGTTETSAMFTGQTGNTYAFYSVARDAVGHAESPPVTADAQTMIEDANSPPTETATPLATSTQPVTPTDTATAVPTHTRTHTPTPTASPTLTSTETPTNTPTPEPTSSATISPSGTPTHSPTHTRTVTPTNTPTREATATPTLPPAPTGCGDVDGDGRVTWRDVVAEALALRLGRNDSRYDINRDGRVNVRDLVLVAHQLGRSCTPTSRANRVYRLTFLLGR